MPTIRRAGLALAGLLAALLVACGGDDPDPSVDSVPPATIVAVTTAQLDRPSVDLKTTQSTTYYPVRGTSTEAIFASIEENGPTDNIGQQGSGLTSVEWEYKWTGDQAPSGVCTIRELSITATIVVELPRHEDEANLPESLRANWTAYVDGVAEHEQRHVDIYLQGAKEIQAAMEEVGVEETCDDLEARIDGIWNDEQARINALQETFHAEENLRLSASRGPLEDEIDANRAFLEGLQSQILTLDQQINFLRAEIAVFDNEVVRIDAQVKQINDQFPDDLPPTIRDRLEQLIEQSNALLLVYNQKVEEHNAAIQTRNQLSNQYDAVLFETNQLVDRYNWTR